MGLVGRGTPGPCVARAGLCQDKARVFSSTERSKVLLKELQSLGLDVRVLRADNTEVEIVETVDYGETDLHSIIEGDRRYESNESYGAHGFSQQEFEGDELVDIEEDFDEPDDMDFDFSYEE